MLVVVYSQGKTGTQSVARMVSGAGHRVFRAHFLATQNVIERFQNLVTVSHWTEVHESILGQVTRSLEIRRAIEQEDDVRIICGVREPVQAGISSFFQTYGRTNPTWREDFERRGEAFLSELLAEASEAVNSRSANPWFNAELKSLIGFDLFAHQFDVDAGYSIYRHGKFTILVYRFEDMKRCLGDALRLLLGHGDFEVQHVNNGNAKDIRFLYRFCSDMLRLDEKALREIHRMTCSHFFYAPAEIENFIRHWHGKTPTRDLLAPYADVVEKSMLSKIQYELVETCIETIRTRHRARAEIYVGREHRSTQLYDTPTFHLADMISEVVLNNHEGPAQSVRRYMERFDDDSLIVRFLARKFLWDNEWRLVHSWLADSNKTIDAESGLSKIDIEALHILGLKDLPREASLEDGRLTA